MSDPTLFDVPITEKITPPVIKPENRCKNCIHLFRHQYRNDWKYCRKQPKHDKRQAYQFKKIGANDPACKMFEKRES